MTGGRPYPERRPCISLSLHDYHSARQLFGHDVRHVLLLHGGAFNTVMLPRLPDQVHKKHFRIVPLEKADGLLEQILASRKLELPPAKNKGRCTGLKRRSVTSRT